MPYRLSRLRTDLRPFRLHYFPRLCSTNNHAAAMRRQGRLFTPAAILTSHQIAGRGRGGHAWFSNADVLTVTFALPIEEHLAPHQLPLIAGLAARRAAAEIADQAPITLKWPNDLLYNGRKLAGLLCERIHKADLIGIGLNVNLNPRHAPSSLRTQITSLHAITGRAFNMNTVLTGLAQHLWSMLERRHEHSFAGFLHEYDAHHALNGKRITVLSDGDAPLTGRCHGLDPTGRLILRDGPKTHHIISGQVLLR